MREACLAGEELSSKLQALLLRAPRRATDGPNAERAHIIYPLFKLSCDDHLRVVSVLRGRLAERYPDFKSKTWEDVLDYPASLRMLYADTWDEKRDDWANRPYTVHAAISDNGTCAPLESVWSDCAEDDHVGLLRLCSIREPTPDAWREQCVLLSAELLAVPLPELELTNGLNPAVDDDLRACIAHIIATLPVAPNGPDTPRACKRAHVNVAMGTVDVGIKHYHRCGPDTMHAKRIPYAHIDTDSGAYAIRCFKPTCPQYKHAQFQGVLPEELVAPLRPSISAVSEPAVGREGFRDDDHTVYREDKMRPLRLPPLDGGHTKQTLLVRAQMGLGKTKALRTFLQANANDYDRIIALTFRQTFASEMHAKLASLGFQHYQKCPPGELTAARIILCVESLHRLRVAAGDKVLLLLDESESILEQANGPLRKHPDVLARVYWLLKAATAVIAMDANLGVHTLDLLRNRYRADSVFGYHENLMQKGGDREYFYTTSKPTWESSLVAALRARRRLVIVSNSKAEALVCKQLVRDEWPEARLGVYTGEEPDDDVKALHFADVNQYWAELDVLDYTPTVTAGCSFEVVDHFEELFAIFGNRTTTVETSRQMMHRVRHLSSKRYTICFDNCRWGNLPTSLDAIELFLTQSADNILNDKIALNVDIRGLLSHRSITADGQGFEFPFKDDHYYNVLHAIRKQRLSSNDFMKRFLQQERLATGARFQLLPAGDEDDEDEMGKRLSLIRAGNKDEEAAAIAAAEDLNDAEAQALAERDGAQSRRAGLTQQDRRALDKYHLRRAYRRTISTPLNAEWVRAYNRPAVRRAFYLKRSLLHPTAGPTIAARIEAIGVRERQLIRDAQGARDAQPQANYQVSDVVTQGRRDFEKLQVQHQLAAKLGFASAVDYETQIPRGTLVEKLSSLEPWLADDDRQKYLVQLFNQKTKFKATRDLKAFLGRANGYLAPLRVRLKRGGRKNDEMYKLEDTDAKLFNGHGQPNYSRDPDESDNGIDVDVAPAPGCLNSH